ncbi:MAG: carboxylating nicotinate-nucleotide diphosphorylase [Candidatus Omnitrophota bacterium]
MKLIKENIYPLIINALREDIGDGDITTTLLFEKDIDVMANISVNEEAVIAGIDVAKWVYNAIDEKIDFTALCEDGARIKKGKKVISIKGSIKNILASERTVLNFLSHLSGVATLTSEFVEHVKGTGAKIFDTRKTTPGLRELEKYAVSVGKGCNHRIGLWDGVLIKDNHLDGMMGEVGTKLGAISDALRRAVGKGYKKIEIEVDNLEEFKEALDMGADIIMLDNMEIKDIKKAVRLNSSRLTSMPSTPISGTSARGKAHLGAEHPDIWHLGARQGSRIIIEVSGGVTLENVKSIAHTGVDRISIGSLTHSASSIDFSLEICK